MKRFLLAFFLLLIGCPALAADLPSGWSHAQEIDVQQSGIVRLPLPYETVNQADATLRDLRLFNPNVTEVPYLLEYPRQEREQIIAVKHFEVAIEKEQTRLTVLTGSERPIEGVTLQTPVSEFLKAITVEGSSDQRRWRRLAENRPIFRQTNGAAQLEVRFEATSAPFLRITLEDHQTPPIPITGILIRKAAGPPPASDPVDLQLIERIDLPGETHLRLLLPSKNVILSEIELITGEALFTRPARLTARKYLNGEIRDDLLVEGTFYRIALEGEAIHAQDRLPVGKIAHGREITLILSNGDAPPLQIRGVRAYLLPVSLLFHAARAGSYHLAFGNSEAKTPQYDLLSMRETITRAVSVPARIGPIRPNPAYVQPKPLPLLPDRASPIDLAPYRFRAHVQLSGEGLHELELGLPVLSHADPSGRDWRLTTQGHQIPYVIDRQGRSRTLSPVARHLGYDPQSRTDRWELLLPYPNLPLTSLSCTVKERLFKRSALLYEEREDSRASTSRRLLGQATWVRTPEEAPAPLRITLRERPQTTRLFLEVERGDNSPLTLDALQFHYQAPHLLFKGSAREDYWLYYGHPLAAFPQYDIALVADALLSAKRRPARLDQEESLQASPSPIFSTFTGSMRLVLWTSLAIATAVLLFIIIKLLPEGLDEK